ncbi:MAG: flagellar assembly protein J [Methanoregulaceae archaeon PtaB.Bin108]|nr:MAG: flagellar assembly protein J [Methanoregulaceae archaeon PtaB.Bin108]OPY44888.1 MAG: flagellar assembly protein J [Methanoregulaceae archaeon PtaU1.Bin222]
MGLGDSFKNILPKKEPGSGGKDQRAKELTTKKLTTQTAPDASPIIQKAGITAKDPGFWGILKGEKPYSVDLGPGEIGRFAKEQIEISTKLEKHKAERSGWMRILKHPAKVLLEKPLNILIVTAPLAIIVFVLGMAFIIRDYGMSVIFTTTLLDDILILSILIAIVPVAFMDFRENRRMKNLEEALPNFFRDLAGMNDSGMTLPNAIHLVAQGEYSTLTPFIRRLDNEMSWNTTFIEAIQRFRTRLGTPLSDRSIDLIAKASKAGGDVSEVLRAAARDTYEVLALRSERSNNMLIYVIIVLISFLVFVFVIFILVSTFLTTMATAGSAASAAGAGAAAFIGNIDLFFYTRLFSHAAMIQGVCSGLVAGQMGEGRVVAGLKYSSIMLIIAWVIFRFMI